MANASINSSAQQKLTTLAHSVTKTSEHVTALLLHVAFLFYKQT